METSACYDPEDQEIIHTGFEDTGERGTNPDTGSEYQVWACKCGEKELEVFPRN